MSYFLPDELRAYGHGIMLYLVVLPRAFAALSRFLLAPNRPEHRIVHTSDQWAKYLYRHQIGIAVLMGFSIWIVEFNVLNGIELGRTRLGFWLNLSVHLYVIFIVWRAWDGLVMMMRGDTSDITPLEYRVGGWYPAYAIIVTALTWVLVNTLAAYQMFEVLQDAPHYKMMIMLLMAPAMDTMVRGLVRHLAPPMTGEGIVAERAYNSTKRSYVRIGRIIVFVIVILIIADLWDIDFTNLAAAGVGVVFAARFIEFLGIVAIGYLVWELVTLMINRKLAAELTAAGIDLNEDEPGGGEGGGAGGSRLSTVLPIIRFTSQTIIVILTVLIALGNVGVDVTPLLAGAGIIGLAVGFGAQTLVRDVVSGVFFLIEDAFRVGEYLVIGDTVGTVENISLRSLQLRHHEGPVHTIPYGEIPRITNNSRDWVIMKMKFTFPFDTDANKIKKLFKKIGADMMEADYADDLIQTFKSQGVYDVDDVGIVIRGKFMAKPGTQWVIRKDIYNRVQKALDEAGIQFARKEVRVSIPGLDENKTLTEDQKQTIGAAAAEAAEKPIPTA